MTPEARVLLAEQLRPGLEAAFERDVAAQDILAFAALSGDHNPLHSSSEYAGQTNYGKPIAHGAFQVGLASTMAGMFLPGRDVVVGTFQCRFPAPLYYPCRVRVTGEITAWVPGTGNGVLRVRVTDLANQSVTAEIHVGFSLHESRVQMGGKEAAAADPRPAADDPGKPLVLVTGASGGIGSVIVENLTADYHVLALSRSGQGAYPAGVEPVAIDLGTEDWEGELAQQLNGRLLYGVVHAAWPPYPSGGLLTTADEAIRLQVEFGGMGVIRVARFLQTCSSPGSRFVILGSAAGTQQPVLNMAAYSLGKALLEQTVRLLAPELARRQSTINLIAPSYVATGMNRNASSRARLTEMAKVPLGKLCEPADIAHAAAFFLAPAAQFVTGQILPLTGGQL
jgi:NAD(P)-dependent dehydrogenase (short-subunit alcohol dehydrogenase family)/acyl dehydratase